MTFPQPEQLLTKRCPLCASTTTTPFLHRSGVPVLTNLLIASQQAAQQVPRGDIFLLVCHTCGFVFNGAFEAASLYDEHYENSQAHAPAFEGYLDELVRSLVIEQYVRQCHILEVGCGDGTFLRKLVEADTGNTGYGFDPAYRGPAYTLDGRLRFAACYYDEACGADLAEVDVLICRHVIEHIPSPLPFLRMLRRALTKSPCVRAFFETPTIEWILRNTIIWDIYYEHCSYFSAETITFALELAGFHVQRIQRTFRGQYLWVETTIQNREQSPTITFGPGSIPTLASQFHRCEQRFCELWRGTLQELLQNGPVALLGAAGKGVTLANLVDPDAQLISCIVDLNPKKQGKFLPGTGHPIVSYEAMRAYGITTAVLLNLNYYHDALRLLDHHRLPVQLIVDTITPFTVSDTKSHQKATLEKNDKATQPARETPFPEQRARLFARLGIRSQETTASPGDIEMLIASLSHREEQERINAAHSIADLYEHLLPEKQIHARINLILMTWCDASAYARIAAIKALARTKTPDVSEALQVALRDEEQDVRATAARALGEIPGKVPVVALVAAAQRAQEHWSVRAAVIRAMGELKERAFLNTITHALEDDDDSVRIAAIRALTQVEGIGAAARLALIAQRERQPHIKHVAILALEDLSADDDELHKERVREENPDRRARNDSHHQQQ